MRPAKPVHTRSLRVRVDLPASLAIAARPAGPVQVIDLSQRGAFVETDLPGEAGSEARLCLQLPERDVLLQSVVARRGTAYREVPHPELDVLVVRRHGLGLRFVSVAAADRSALERFLARAREG